MGRNLGDRPQARKGGSRRDASTFVEIPLPLLNALTASPTRPDLLPEVELGQPDLAGGATSGGLTPPPRTPTAAAMPGNRAAADDAARRTGSAHRRGRPRIG